MFVSNWFQKFFKFKLEIRLIQTSDIKRQGVPSFYDIRKVRVLKNSLFIIAITKALLRQLEFEDKKKETQFLLD